MVKSIHSEAATQGESRCGNHDWFGFAASFRISSPTQPSHYSIQKDLTLSHYSTYRRVSVLTLWRVLCMTVSNYWGTLVVGKHVFRVPALGDECPRMRLRVPHWSYLEYRFLLRKQRIVCFHTAILHESLEVTSRDNLSFRE